MDMVDFNPIEEGEEDHHLQDFFPEQVPYHLQHLIEYVKIPWLKQLLIEYLLCVYFVS